MYLSNEELDMLKIMIDCLNAQVELIKEEQELVEKIHQKVLKEKAKRVT
ncbi:hypothetical protein BRE01_31130 [Brevibacillus reuszeri]|uniref:Transposase n=1 Tax=Brevibacillus reuszeri TaxID=54915 RepID=A0ABQ0TNH9_9BACL|nr:hypothetical protein BRE01_31130 [Brevibacillus reuszeri]